MRDMLQDIWDEYCSGDDGYVPVYSGDDLASYSDTGFGIHYTDSLPVIMKNGIGSPRRYLYDNEIGLAICLLSSGRFSKAAKSGFDRDVVEELFFRQFKNIHILWCGISMDYSGETSTSYKRSTRTLIDLAPFGDWIVEHSKLVSATFDNAGGIGVFWDGPSAPSEFIIVDE